MVISMAATVREDSKKTTQESHAITRLSYLPFIFVCRFEERLKLGSTYYQTRSQARIELAVLIPIIYSLELR